MYLVFDIGGTTVKYAYMTHLGDIKERGTFKTQKESPDSFYQSIINVKNNFDDVNTCILRIELTHGLLLSHVNRYEIDFSK